MKLKNRMEELRDNILEFLDDHLLAFFAAVLLIPVLSLFVATVEHEVQKDNIVKERQGTYIIFNDDEMRVYTNDTKYEYKIEPATELVYTSDADTSISTGLTKDDFIKALKDKGLKEWEDNAAE